MPPLDLGEKPELIDRLLRIGSALSDPVTAGFLATLLAVGRCSARVSAQILNEAPDDVLQAVRRLLEHGAVQLHGGVPDSPALDTLVMLTPGLRESLPPVVRELGGIGSDR